MKSDVFNFNRFWRYFKTDLSSGLSNYGISLVVLATIEISIELFTGVFTLTNTGSWHGLELPLRLTMFGIFGAVALISAPAKLYGQLTDKKEGTAFIMLPASVLEKYISMILICAIVVPAVFIGLYSLVDMLVCAVDPTAGMAVISSVGDFRAKIMQGLAVDIENAPFNLNKMMAFTNPLLYVDDLIYVVLAFLLGAIFFKKSKTAKTFGCIVLLSMVMSMIFTPIVMLTSIGDIVELSKDPLVTDENVFEKLPMLCWAFEHLALLDTITDTLWNVALLFLIWLRLKRMKH